MSNAIGKLARTENKSLRLFTSPESCWLGRFGLKRVEELARTVESIHEGFTFFVYETGKLEENNLIAFFDENFA